MQLLLTLASLVKRVGLWWLFLGPVIGVRPQFFGCSLGNFAAGVNDADLRFH